MRGLRYGIAASQRGGTAVTASRDVTSVAAQSGISVDFGTLFSSVLTSLPSQVVCTLDDASLVALNITWLEGTYDESIAATYNLEGTLQLIEGITNSTNIKGNVSVTVNAAQTFDVYVSPSGNDGNSGLSEGSPKLTIPAAITTAQGLGGQRTIKAAAGTYTLTARISWPVNISFTGSGVDVTIIKGSEALNSSYVTGTFAYNFDHALLRLETGGAASGPTTAGNQTLRDFTLDCSKISNSNTRGQRLGIHIKNRDTVVIKNVKIRKSTFVGIQLANVATTRITECEFIDNSYGEAAFATGNISWEAATDLEIDNNTVNEGFGNGIKPFAGPNGLVLRLKLHDNYVSVTPTGQWAGGGAPNIAFEHWGMVSQYCDIYNNYFDNNVSLIKDTPATAGIPTFHVYNNTMDMITRANGAGYCLELHENYAEVDGNYMIGGTNATIANWHTNNHPAVGNWNIHHNVIRVPQGFYPSGIVRSEHRGLHNVNFYNNFVHVLPGQNRKVQVFVTYAGSAGDNGSSDNINCRNNIFYDQSTANSEHGENVLIQLAGSMQNFLCTHNYFFGIPVGSIAGGTYNNNFTTNPQITLAGTAPDPYYRPLPGSPVINAGINVGLPYTGSAPTIGAYELAGVVETGDIVSVETVPARSITTGIPWATVNSTLPTVATITLDDDSQVNLTVTWAQGSYNSAVENTYNIVGTLTLVSGVLNPSNLTALVAITVTESTVYFTDSFDRASLGSNYTIQGNVTATLDNNDMTMDITGTGTSTDRIVRNTWDNNIDHFRSLVIFSPGVVNTQTIGLGVGIQNAVNPDPNFGVYMLFDTSTLADAGRVSILSGDGTLSDGSFITRMSSSGTPLPIVVDRRYLADFRRELSGADVLYTAIVTDLVTEASITTTWIETGSPSLAYNQQHVLYQLGGIKLIEDWTVYNDDEITSTVLLDDIFDRTTLSPWTEVDASSELTVTMNNPYVTLQSAVFAASRMITYGTLGTSLYSWRMTVDFRFTTGSIGSILIGTKNQPVNPNVNRAILVRANQVQPAEDDLEFFNGDGTINDGYAAAGTTTGTMTYTNNQDYRVTLERTYNGSGDAVYHAEAYLISSPGTVVEADFTSTGAPEQGLYASTRWSISIFGTTCQVRRVLIEQL